jgi:hypothetical protein
MENNKYVIIFILVILTVVGLNQLTISHKKELKHKHIIDSFTTIIHKKDSIVKILSLKKDSIIRDTTRIINTYPIYVKKINNTPDDSQFILLKWLITKHDSIKLQRHW